MNNYKKNVDRVSLLLMLNVKGVRFLFKDRLQSKTSGWIKFLELLLYYYYDLFS